MSCHGIQDETVHCIVSLCYSLEVEVVSLICDGTTLILLSLDVVDPLYGAAQAYREDYSKQLWK